MTGATPNLAARLQSAAPPGGVVIEATTRALVRQSFDLEDLGQQDLKGFAAPVQAWRVRAARAAESRFDSRADTLTPLAGRTHEVGLLCDRWEQARSGEGQVVLIAGEAGIGKSRILQAFRAQVEGRPQRWLGLQCSPYHVNTALHPVIQQLEHGAGIEAGDAAAARLDKLEALLRQGATNITDIAPLMAALLSLPVEERYGALDLTPAQQRVATLRGLQDHLLGLAAHELLVVVLEDAHWIDPTTQQLIAEMVLRLVDQRVLVVMTHRPEWVHPFQGHGHVTTISLTRLSRAQVADMVRELASRHLPEAIVARIVERTDGVPLFVEELTKAIVEAGTDAGFDSLEDDVPVTLQASLMARLDRLGSAKEIAQIGAVIGREFSHQLLTRIAETDDSDLSRALERLQESQLVFRASRAADAFYTFKHALIQDVAYKSLLRQRRQRLHLTIAEALEADASPEVVARHFELGGDAMRAITWWERAGDDAVTRSAQPEAASHFGNALRLTRATAGNDHRATELSLLLRLGQAQFGAYGGAAPITSASFEAAAALAAELDGRHHLCVAQYGQWIGHVIAGRLRQALALADDMVAWTQVSGESWATPIGARLRASTLGLMGQLAPARALFEALIAAAPRLESALSMGFAHDPLLGLASNFSHIEWATGDMVSARARSAAAVETIAAATRNANTVSYAMTWDVLLSAFARDPVRVRVSSERLREHARRTGGMFWEQVSHWGLGAAAVMDGDTAAALPLLRSGIDGFVRTGALQHVPFFKLSLAEAHHLDGDDVAALAVLDESRALIEKTEQRFYEPETLRWRGIVLGAMGRHDEALAALRQAIAVADGQGSQAWQARAEADLARLLDGA